MLLDSSSYVQLLGLLLCYGLGVTFPFPHTPYPMDQKKVYQKEIYYELTSERGLQPGHSLGRLA